MFQSGDVDYLVATDAVSMGLNLDVDHVALASDANMTAISFAGSIRPNSPRSPAAPAAPRVMGLGPPRCAPFEPELVNALQNHTFRA
jgi:ATP-dependent RNA helicase SUPV3L1/SUV3